MSSFFLRDVINSSYTMQKLESQQHYTCSNAAARYPMPNVLRSLQLRTKAIDEFFFKVVRDLFFSALVVEGGSTGGYEYGYNPNTEANSGTINSTGNDEFVFNKKIKETLNSIRIFFSEKLPLIRTSYQDELTLFLRLFLFRFTVWDRNAFFGDRLQNLVYRSEYENLKFANKGLQSLSSLSNAVVEGVPNQNFDENLTGFGKNDKSIGLKSLTKGFFSWLSFLIFGNSFLNQTALVNNAYYRPKKLQKILLFVFLYLFPYFLDKFRRYVIRLQLSNSAFEPEVEEKLAFYNRILLAAEKIETICMLLDLLNLIVFFAQGKYRSLSDRILGLRLVTGPMKMTRYISLELMNQQLFWTATFNFFSFIMTVFNFNRLIGNISRSNYSSSISGLFGMQRPDLNSSAGHLLDNLLQSASGQDRCQICHNSIILPRLTNCGHKFCYYCIASHVGGRINKNVASFRYACPRCGQNVTSITPVPPVSTLDSSTTDASQPA